MSAVPDRNNLKGERLIWLTVLDSFCQSWWRKGGKARFTVVGVCNRSCLHDQEVEGLPGARCHELTSNLKPAGQEEIGLRFNSRSKGKHPNHYMMLLRSSWLFLKTGANCICSKSKGVSLICQSTMPPVIPLNIYDSIY